MSGTPPPLNPNRRNNMRSGAVVGVKFHAVEEAAKALKAFSMNLSSGGLCLRTRVPHRVGECLTLKIEIDGNHFLLNGEVAWGKEDVVGIRFVEVTPHDRVRLEAVVCAATKGSVGR